MKRITFITIFIFTHIIFVFSQIYKNALFIKQSYQKQKNERLRDSLYKKKESLDHQLCALKNNSSIKKYAQENLNMVQLRVHQIKTLSNHDKQ